MESEFFCDKIMLTLFYPNHSISDSDSMLSVKKPD